MRRRDASVVPAVLLGALLAGCYESPRVTLHEPGVYRGPHDPLLDKTSALASALEVRFDRVQRDR
ncbi:MAG: hypothetical protein RLW61_16055 [Gammaproteobacteria bacterium]|uniref:hypothetical protein n=1 Tax=Oceanibaculum nanhaiense TaxID=1909734 RepID=UPI0032EF2A53